MRKTIYKSDGDNNQHATSFTNKNQHATSFTNKNHHATGSKNKISFTRRKINVQVSQSEKPACNKFNKKKSGNSKFHEQTMRKQRIP